MNSPPSSENSVSNESSPSEGEYSVQQAEKEDGPAKFDFSSWNPEPPAGIQFLGLLPVGQGPSSQGYQLLPQSDPRDHVGKIKVSKSRRESRHKEYYRGAPVARDVHDEKKLRNACSNGDFHTVHELLQDGVDPCGVDNRKRSPLHIAAARGDEQIVKILLDSGANPNLKDVIGNTPLHLAACTSNIPVVTLLLQAGTDVNSLDTAGKTPLHLACGRLRVLQEDTSWCSKQVKEEVNQVISMLQAYLRRSGTGEGELNELNKLCEQLALSSTKEELDSLGGLLSDFANLQIKKKTQSS